jgi:hypothetical protein
MAGLDDVQWGIVKDGLEKIDVLARGQAESELRLTNRLSAIELALSDRIRGIETGLFKGNGTKSLKERVDDLECEPDKKKNWIATLINLVIALGAVGIAFFKP